MRPIIEPFSFPKSLHQSQRYNLLCTVVKGDQPIQVSISLSISLSSLFLRSLLHFTLQSFQKSLLLLSEKKDKEKRKSLKQIDFDVNSLILLYIFVSLLPLKRQTNRLNNKIASKTD